MQQWIDEQFQPWIGVNENFQTLEHQAVYGKRHAATAGLTWGYYGGRWSDFAITEDTVTLTASATNHLVVARATGVFSTATASTNWDNTADYARVYKITTGTGSVTGVEDHRLATAGVHVSTSTTTVATTSWKQAVRAASTANGTLATAFENGDTLDGVTLATGDRILLKNQSTGAENGIYTVNATGAPTRATDADSGAELVNATVFVSEGTANSDTQWTCTTNAPITLESTALVFAQNGVGGGDASTNTSSSVDSEVALFSSTGGKTLKRATGTGYAMLTSGVLGAASTATAAADLQSTGLTAGAVGFREIPQNSQSTAYTTVAADSGKHLLHPAADTTARTFTIAANASVAYPVGTAITFVNQNGGGVVTISINSDTMRLAGAGTTGSRTLAANGVATAIKITSTEWIISGTGLT